MISLLSRIFSPFLCETRSSTRQGAVGHEAPPQNRGTDHEIQPRFVQERQEARGDSVPQQPEGA